MSTRRSRRLHNSPLQTSPIDASSDAARFVPTVSSECVSLKDPPEAIPVTEKQDTLESDKMENAVKPDDNVTPSTEVVHDEKSTLTSTENDGVTAVNCKIESGQSEDVQPKKDATQQSAEEKNRISDNTTASTKEKEEAVPQNETEVKKDGEVSKADSESAAIHPTRRHRTRSTSSAVSSISGESDGAENPKFENDGKTPLIANRRSKRANSISSFRSQGPVRKRHKGRALFGDSGLSNVSTELSLFQESLLQNESEDILVTIPRSRSNTMDSFRAAMDSTSNNELSESLVFPEMTMKASVGTINLMSKCEVLVSPTGRSDTIDFLTAAVGGDLDNDTGDNGLASSLSPIKISGDTLPKPEKTASNTNHHEDVHKGKRGVAFGKTPKKNNLSGESFSNHDPIKKRYRTRSLSYTDPDPGGGSLDPLEIKQKADMNEDAIVTASVGSATRSRSNTLESFQNALTGRTRSDTMDFLAAAVAGDMGHDLDAAIAAASAEGASFAMHPISAPSGASISHASNAYHPSTRSRSNTLDSTASSINSSKLDFLISVAVEEGGVFGFLAEEKVRDRTASIGTDPSEHAQRRPRSNTLEMYSNMAAGRGRSDTIDFLTGGNDHHSIDDAVTLPDDNTSSGCVLDHLKALCAEPFINSSNKTTGILRRGRLSSGAGEAGSYIVASPKAKFDDESTKKPAANSDHTNPSNSLDSSSQRILMEALQHFEGDKRYRHDSWGGMSDLSVTGIAATHDALKSTGIIDDIMAAAADLDDELSEEPPDQSQRKRTGSGGTNSLSGKGRPRLDSLASLSLASLSDASISVSGRKELYAAELVKKLPTSGFKTETPSSQSIVVDYDAIAAAVNAANAATEGLDLNSILSSPTPSAAKPPSSAYTSKTAKPSEKAAAATSKPASKPLKITNPPAKLMAPKTHMPRLAIRPTPNPTTIVNSYSAKYQTAPKPMMTAPSPSIAAKATQKTIDKRVLLSQPVLSTQISEKSNDLKPKPPVPSSIDIPIPKCTKTEAELEAIRQRARAAAGYVPPVPGSMPYKAGSMPYKVPHRKPPAPYHPMAPPAHPNMPLKKRPNAPLPPFVPSMPVPPPGYIPRHPQSRASSLQSQQKWDDMFEYLVKFIEETRAEETKGMTEEEKSSWVWDGNVPTNYKTKCGKALGRWINNQRTSKTKGTLKDDREVRLVSTGLKWSVLTTNSWNEMLRELEIYAEQKRQDGKIWDGNVPTNYKITVERTCGGRKMEEEKNLGRWVNRQRSLYQSGKLKKERQFDLEKVGLKWSVLLIASWATMYECLCNYANERRAENNGLWDGNVPSNWRIESKPPVNLGRWVNRQRCAYAKGRLKQEFVMKLERTGLKWSMHDQKRSGQESDDEDDFEGEEFIPKDEYKGKVAPETVPSKNPPSIGVVTSVATNANQTAGAPSSSGLYFTTPAGVKETVVVSSLPHSHATTTITSQAVSSTVKADTKG